MFWKVEGRTGLYVFFKTVCDVYGLIPEDNYTIPPEAEGVEPPAQTTSTSIPPLILKREASEPNPYDSNASTLTESMADHSLSTAGTTKRHRHSPSVGATSVQTVVEESEEEEDRPSLQSRPVTQIFEATEEDEGDDITVLEDAESAEGDVEATEESSAADQSGSPADDNEAEEGVHDSEAVASVEAKSEETEEPSKSSAPEKIDVEPNTDATATEITESVPSTSESKATEDTDPVQTEEAKISDAAAEADDNEGSDVKTTKES